MLTVIVPAFNEQATIAELLGRLYAVPELQGRIQVIVVDDGSTDDTFRM